MFSGVLFILLLIKYRVYASSKNGQFEIEFSELIPVSLPMPLSLFTQLVLCLPPSLFLNPILSMRTTDLELHCISGTDVEFLRTLQELLHGKALAMRKQGGISNEETLIHKLSTQCPLAFNGSKGKGLAAMIEYMAIILEGLKSESATASIRQFFATKGPCMVFNILIQGKDDMLAALLYKQCVQNKSKQDKRKGRRYRRIPLFLVITLDHISRDNVDPSLSYHLTLNPACLGHKAAPNYFLYSVTILNDCDLPVAYIKNFKKEETRKKDHGKDSYVIDREWLKLDDQESGTTTTGLQTYKIPAMLIYVHYSWFKRLGHMINEERGLAISKPTLTSLLQNIKSEKLDNNLDSFSKSRKTENEDENNSIDGTTYSISSLVKRWSLIKIICLIIVPLIILPIIIFAIVVYVKRYLKKKQEMKIRNDVVNLENRW